MNVNNVELNIVYKFKKKISPKIILRKFEEKKKFARIDLRSTTMMNVKT